MQVTITQNTPHLFGTTKYSIKCARKIIMTADHMEVAKHSHCQIFAHAPFVVVTRSDRTVTNGYMTSPMAI